MSWKINSYLGATLVALFVLLNFIPTEQDLALLLGLLFLVLLLITVLSFGASALRAFRKKFGARRKR